MSTYGFHRERIELPLIYQEYSIDEITNRWTRFYIHRLPERLQERNQIAAMLVGEIKAGRLQGDPVLYYQHQPFSRPHKTQVESGWLTYTIMGGYLRRYEEEQFGTDSHLDKDEQPYFGMDKRNRMKRFGEVRRNAKGAGVDQVKFIKAWIKIGMPMYWKADGIYCQSTSSDVFYKLSGFYKVVHGHGVGMADLIEVFSEQPTGWGDVDVIYCAIIRSVVGLDAQQEFIPSIKGDKLYMLGDDIRKLEERVGEEFYFCHDQRETLPVPAETAPAPAGVIRVKCKVTPKGDIVAAKTKSPSVQQMLKQAQHHKNTEGYYPDPDLLFSGGKEKCGYNEKEAFASAFKRYFDVSYE
ncbi:MAG: hypothetical protein BWK73_37755 [Thiothrix lacustris]|uniref:Uncharacterized protein n=1 Tax=Thiothrix lacustris TaxID=525917 RepID=A0A1Y1QET6_9GAMM|nr:MAG: hypothetical protein BWK73_37755 [Thiothrix lacustris]